MESACVRQERQNDGTRLENWNKLRHFVKIPQMQCLFHSSYHKRLQGGEIIH